MSDPQPDREKEGAAPEGPKNPWVRWFVWAILTPVLYVLSVGPVLWLTDRGYLPGIFAYLYVPLSFLPNDIGMWIVRYISWWTT